MKDFCPIFLASQKFPSQIAFRSGGRDVSFSQVEALVCGLAVKLSGLELSSRVSVLSKNNLEMVILFFALQRLGVSVVLHNTRLTVGDWRGQAELASVGCGFVSAEFKEIAPFERVYLLPELDFGADFDLADSPVVDCEKESVVIFTSGSTGVGKGVRLSLRNLISNAQASNQVNDLAIGDTWLASLPFFHVGGLCILFRTILAGASSLVTELHNANETFLRLGEVSHVSLVPPVLEEILEIKGGYEKIKRLKNILLGGSPSDDKLLEKITQLPIRTSYGMSETSSHISILDKNETYQIQDLQTSGKLLNGVEVKISSEGEICLRGPSIFKGYLGQDDRKIDQWFFTGDLGCIDSKGRLIIEGRKDRTIISGGENINPKQIEDLVLAISGVKQAAVIGVADMKWGARPYLFVVVEKGFLLSSLTKVLMQKLPKYKVPDKIISLNALPKTAIGKIDYIKLTGYCDN